MSQSNASLVRVPSTSVLSSFEAAKRALAEARSIDEVKQAEALRLYVKQQGDSLEMQKAVAEIKLRAERKAGELLIAMEKNKGARGVGVPSHEATRWLCRVKRRSMLPLLTLRSSAREGSTMHRPA
jgi:hypothetical protein